MLGAGEDEDRTTSCEKANNNPISGPPARDVLGAAFYERKALSDRNLEL